MICAMYRKNDGSISKVSFCFFQLEEVMETETYKNAKMILERFDPDSRKKMVSFVFTLKHKTHTNVFHIK